MAIARDPTSAEIAHYLVTRSGAEMLQLMQSIRAPIAQAALSTTMLHMPPAVKDTATPPEKARKALNAFVGFRCYYILIPDLKPWPMKMLSNLMGVMWEADPNKSLWSLMTKAWSVIRDQIGKDKAPLHHFFRIICPYLNLPSPEVYFKQCGWTLTVDKDGKPTLSKETSDSQDTLSAGIAGTALSVEDIINYCQSFGYAQEYIPDSETSSPTFLAQPSTPKSSSVKPMTETADPIHDLRVAARNKRRAKRQAAKDPSVASELRKQIAHAHHVSSLHATCHDSSFPAQNEPVQFYDNLADLLTDNFGQIQEEVPGVSGDFVAAGDIDMTGWTDWGAFRLGADENATLPSFDLANF